MKLPIAAGILAGGRSERMGRDKAELVLGGVPLLQRCLDALRPLTDEVVISARGARNYARFGVLVVHDRLEPPCPLAGIHAILSSIRSDAAFVCGVDLPFLHEGLIRRLYQCLSDHDAVVPESRGKVEPLYAIYRKRCLPAIERAFAEGRLAVPAFYPDCRVRVEPVDESDWLVDGRSPFKNLNRPEDLEGFDPV